MFTRAALIFILCISNSIQLFSQQFKLPQGIREFDEPDAVMTDDYVFVTGKHSYPDGIAIIALNRKTQKATGFVADYEASTFAGYRETENDVDLYLREGQKGVLMVRFSKTSDEFGKPREVTNKDNKYPVVIVTEEGAVVLSYERFLKRLTLLKDDGVNTVADSIYILRKDDDMHEYLRGVEASNSYNPDFEPTYYGQRWHWRDNRLVMIDDDFDVKGSENETIRITTLDPKDRSITYQAFELEHKRGATHKSYLFEGKLFVVAMDKEGKYFDSEYIAIDIYDFKTLTKIKGNHYSYQQLFMPRAGNAYKNNEKIAIKNVVTSGIFTAIGRGAIGNPVITVNNAGDSLLEVMIGNLKSGGGERIPMATYGGAGGAPTFVSAPVGRYSEQLTFIIGLMDKSTLQPLDRQWKMSNSEERRLDWLDAHKKKAKNTAIARRNGKVVIVSLDKNKIEVSDL